MLVHGIECLHVYYPCMRQVLDAARHVCLKRLWFYLHYCYHKFASDFTAEVSRSLLGHALSVVFDLQVKFTGYKGTFDV